MICSDGLAGSVGSSNLFVFCQMGQGVGGGGRVTVGKETHMT